MDRIFIVEISISGTKKDRKLTEVSLDGAHREVVERAIIKIICESVLT